jgi:hypothetical protein
VLKWEYAIKAYFRKAVALREKKQFLEAIQVLEKGLTMEPTEGEAKALKMEMAKCAKAIQAEDAKVKKTCEKMMAPEADVD